MSKAYWLAMSAVLAIAISGCGNSTGTNQSSASPKAGDAATKTVAQDAQQLEGPAAATYEFLEALRTGNDEKAGSMLSTLAREKAASMNRSVTPPASDTARFTIGKVDYVSDDGARVACTWTDIDEDGQAKSDDAIWVLRREEDGWRVAGVAALIFPGEPPLMLNFEDPEDMFKKQQWVREEFRRRIEAGGLQAQGGEKQEKPIRR